MLSMGVPLFHDNARPNSAGATAATIRQLKFELIPHPLYNPNLVPWNCHVLGPLKKSLRGRRFESDDKIKGVVRTYLHPQLKSFFLDDFKSFGNHYIICAKNGGGGLG